MYLTADSPLSIKPLSTSHPKPWRKLDDEGSWTKEYREKLLEEINGLKFEDEGIGTIRILLLGQIKAGKSSFVNTLASIDKNRIAEITRAGGADKSLTFALKEYTPTGALKKNICILDTMGYEEAQFGLNVKDIIYLVKGNICPGYKFNPASPIEQDSAYYRPNPQKSDRIHCIVFVADANIFGQDNVTAGAMQKQKELDEALREDVARCVLLTKIDVLCQSVETDVTNTYRSEKVKQAVQRAAEFFCVQERNILPIKNYEKETATDTKIEILILLALRQMMRFAKDFYDGSASGQTPET
ncbi:interferon-induced protein 44-like [Ruditapes philippinarum]|uniref:interferon-induced protein 44-like n=1 Tax=Ruditapes philippinarum TaxID=129788 RepID=UPI00295B8618|nr:interferon-induced protein 44-like [Ruditapes philippinarum]